MLSLSLFETVLEGPLPGESKGGVSQKWLGKPARPPTRDYCWLVRSLRNVDEKKWTANSVLVRIAEKTKWIQGLAVQANFIVKMGTGSPSSGAHIAYDIALLDLLTWLDRESVQMPIAG